MTSVTKQYDSECYIERYEYTPKRTLPSIVNSDEGGQLAQLRDNLPVVVRNRYTGKICTVVRIRDIVVGPDNVVTTCTLMDVEGNTHSIWASLLSLHYVLDEPVTE